MFGNFSVEEDSNKYTYTAETTSLVLAITRGDFFGRVGQQTVEKIIAQEEERYPLLYILWRCLQSPVPLCGCHSHILSFLPA